MWLCSLNGRKTKSSAKSTLYILMKKTRSFNKNCVTALTSAFNVYLGLSNSETTQIDISHLLKEKTSQLNFII